ncbi:3818_t:CDS:2 [Funneliformis caledonium]|uniref:3818_t:CDS:1 n=1 Tax=Funneliformis caledonium TaxID=1117310 RepID=A0A9N8V4C7_9GLOM|nr:3818_t:CDS:2 [Funneliformis caledonium]
MISAEAPILFAKGCDIFITELTMRAWHHAEECKRRTLQRSDIANAIKKVDMFDFLIDIVPREEKVSVKNDKMDYQDQSQYPYGLGMPQSGHQFNPSPSMPVDHKIIVDPMTLHEQQVPSYRAQPRPPYASVPTDVSAGPSVRQVTTEQSYHPPYYHHQPSIQNFQEPHHRQQQQAPSQHQIHRQSDHNPVQVKYEFESSAARPVDWYSQQNTQLTNNGHTHGQSGYVQGSSQVSSSHGYGQPLSQSSHDYNHESTSMHLTRHDESYVRGGGVQRN